MKNRNISIILTIILSLILSVGISFSQENKKPMKEWTDKEFFDWYKKFMQRRGTNYNALGKPTAGVDRKAEGIMNGNRIRTLFTNFGSVGQPKLDPSLEWPIYSGVGYGYEFGPVLGAKVVTINGDTIHILNDALIDGGERANPRLNTGNVMGWEPLPGYAAPSPNESPAKSNNISTWPAEWESWPGLYGEGVITADQEAYWVMDDRFNDEFDYFPVNTDETIRGLGVQVTCRLMQYSAQIAEDIIFCLYEIKLREDAKPLDQVVIGMVGDPHIGGGSDYRDDYAGFDQDMNLVYAWDAPGSSNDYNLESVGYLGFMFLESPSNYSDGIDNDEDGIIDESRHNGIDDDGDWDATDEEAKADPDDSDGLSDDIGSDGIPDTNDSDGTEGNGIPDPGEPDFEWADVDESDEIGLTSMAAPVYGTITGAMDERMWEQLIPGSFGNIQQNSDNLFIFGSGYFSLQPGETQRFSIAIIIGEDENDLRSNAEVAQTIYRRNFQFTKAPDKPTLTAVASDKKVTLYWDSNAENSVDPLLGSDFEGYAIYKSTDKGVTWGKPITNNRGIQVYWEPLARFDIIDEIIGPHDLGVDGIHYYMGEDTGLRHSFVDSTVSNGITYYYAVCSYDQGSTTFGSGIVPVECSRSLGDINVVAVTPNAPAAGYVKSEVSLNHTEGIANGRMILNIIDPEEVSTDICQLTFSGSSPDKKFNIYNSTQDEFIVSDQPFVDGEPYLFKGLKLTMFDWSDVDTWDENSGWFNSDCDYTYNLSFFSYRKPSDYEVRFFDTNVDTSVNNIAVPFEIWNITENKKLDFGLADLDKSGTWTASRIVTKTDYMALREEINGTMKYTWKITITESDTVWSSDDPPQVVQLPKPPGAGTVLRIVTTREFTDEDVYEISATPPYEDKEKAKVDLDKIAVVPNPYVGGASWEQPTEFRTGRGDRRIDFINLPKKCTIRIYTMNGDHVRTIEHDGGMEDGTESWNLMSKDGMEIAFGVYIFHIDAPGIGTKIGKFAIIK